MPNNHRIFTVGLNCDTAGSQSHWWLVVQVTNWSCDQVPNPDPLFLDSTTVSWVGGPRTPLTRYAVTLRGNNLMLDAIDALSVASRDACINILLHSNNVPTGATGSRRRGMIYRSGRITHRGVTALSTRDWNGADGDAEIAFVDGTPTFYENMATVVGDDTFYPTYESDGEWLINRVKVALPSLLELQDNGMRFTDEDLLGVHLDPAWRPGFHQHTDPILRRSGLARSFPMEFGTTQPTPAPVEPEPLIDLPTERAPRDIDL